MIDLVKITELLFCSRQTIKGVISLIRFGKGEILIISYPFCGVGLAFRRFFENLIIFEGWGVVRGFRKEEDIAVLKEGIVAFDREASLL